MLLTYHRVVALFVATIIAGSLVIPGSAEKLPGMLLDYRNTFLSYEQKGLDTCPFTFYRETCSDFAHVTIVSTPNTTCLGTFISEQFALVKASCLPPAGTQPASIRLSGTKIPQPIAAAAVFIHPDFQRSSSGPSVMDLAIVKLKGALSFNQNVAASCLWASDSLEMYSKVQEVFYDLTTSKMKQNSTICTGDSRNDCLKSVQRQWCQRKSPNSLLQIRELGKYKMHPMLASVACDSNGEIVSMVQYLPWIREVTKNTDIEYDLTNSGSGEKCTKGETGEEGVCLPIEKCPQVLKNFKKLQHSDKISTCGFEGHEPLACCATEDMLVSPEKQDTFSGIVAEIEQCERMYDEFRRTPEEYQLNAQVAIIDLHESLNCSATLITARYLLTSAQCVSNTNLKNAVVWFGMSNDIDGVSQSNGIHSIYPHPKFNPKTNRNNVAVVKLTSPVLIQPYSVPACLWHTKSKMPTALDSTGFDQAERTIAVTSASPMYYGDCRRLYNPELIPAEMCVHHQPLRDCGPQDVPSSCGDPGSGLYSTLYVGQDEMKPVTYLVGVYSYGFQCDKGGPAIYSRVSEYYAWIKSVIYLTAQEKD